MRTFLFGLSAALLVLTAAPAASFAKVSGNAHANAHAGATVNVSASSADNSRCTPPGHLIAPGWLRKHLNPTVLLCRALPPGIAKKLGVQPPTPGNDDTTAPVISAIAANAGTS